MIKRINRRDKSYLPKLMAVEQTGKLFPWFIEDFIYWLSQPKVYCYVYYNEDSSIIGYIIFKKMLTKCHILNIVVHKDYIGTGVAKELMTKLPVDKNIDLEVATINERAIAFYKKNGFKIIKEKVNYYEEGFNAYSMRKEKIK